MSGAWLDLARFALLVVGFAYFVTQSSIFMPIRVTVARVSGWARMFVYCAMCVSFWAGGVLAVVLRVQPFHGNPAMVDLWDYSLRFVQYGLMGMAVAHTWLYLTNSGAAAQIEHDMIMNMEQTRDPKKAPEGRESSDGRDHPDE